MQRQAAARSRDAKPQHWRIGGILVGLLAQLERPSQSAGTLAKLNQPIESAKAYMV